MDNPLNHKKYLNYHSNTRIYIYNIAILFRYSVFRTTRIQLRFQKFFLFRAFLWYNSCMKFSKLPIAGFFVRTIGGRFTKGPMFERNKAILYKFIVYPMLIFSTYLVAVFCIPLAYLHTQNFAAEALTSPVMMQYFRDLWNSCGVSVISYYFNWGYGLIFGKGVSWLPFLPIAYFIFYFEKMNGSQPYKNYALFKSGMEADTHHIEAMGPFGTKGGLFAGKIIVLGKFKGRLLRMQETLSALVCAPPGTGKTAAVVVPTIFECPEASMVVNDPKPELCYTTSGFRATLGPTFIINWGESDNPDAGIYYPRWNPLSPDLIPPVGPERDMYIDSITAVLIQDAKGSSADPHWSSAGRNALSGMLHFMASKCEKATANDYFYYKLKNNQFTSEDAQLLAGYYMVMDDPYAKGALRMLQNGQLTISNYIPVGTWENIPKEWVGREASLPMILDWLSEAQILAAEELNKRKQQGDQMAAFNTDIVHDVMENATKEARKYSYSHRAVLELNQLANTPDKERGSIISNVLTNTSIFKNSAVRERTCASDIAFKDLRGVIDPADGKMKPVTIYLSVNQADARALNVISGVFIELMSKYLIANPPGHVGRSGENGPFPVIFVLDEFPQMPKLEAVMDGPAVGRGMKVSYLLIAQDLGQIEAGYGKDAVETLISTTAAKVILNQNNDLTSKRFVEMGGSGSVVQEHINDGPKVRGFKNLSTKEHIEIGESTLTAGGLMNLPMGTQYVLYQGHMKYPIKADSPLYFKEPMMIKKAAMPSAPPVPEWIRLKDKR